MPKPSGFRLVHALAALAAVAVACGAWAGSASAKIVTDSVTHQRFSISAPLAGRHAAPAAPAAPGPTCFTDCTPLLYEGGPVQHGEHDYMLFWLPSGYSFPAGYESGLKTWLDGVAAADGTTENPFSVDTQYYDDSGGGGARSYVPYDVQDAGTRIDTDPYPSSACTDKSGSTTESVCLTDSQIRSEVASYVSANHLPTGINTEYFLFTPADVGSCFDSSSGTCAYSGYCGYHSAINTGSTSSEIVYANMPWLFGTSGCDVNLDFGAGYPNPGDIDSTVSVFSHELSESMTDPNLNAWLDSSDNEIGDKCAYIYAPDAQIGALGNVNNNGLGYWNVPLAGGDYLMQTEFDQRISDCAVGLTTTWTGASAAAGFSQPGSWAGALAPTSAVDTLSFPALTKPACITAPVTAVCYSADNDISGLTANAISIDDGVGYSVTGDALTLGSGGVAASTSASSPTASGLHLPITLGASQTWTISGAAGGGAGLALDHAVSGSGQTLQVDLSNQATLNLGADDEIGAVTVSGANPGDSGSAAAQNGTLTSTSRLNGIDAHPVALDDVAMTTGPTVTTGPLASTGASLQVGQGHAGALSVAGGLSLDAASQLTLFIDGPGSTAGSDYSQISATGPVTLSGALALASGTSGCPTLSPGHADTLITTTGAISGTFSGIPNGTVVTLSCGSQSPTVQIAYTPHTVTATAVSATPAIFQAPSIAGLAEPGQSLTETPGEWLNAPTSIVDEWERCDTSGANCAAIATGQRYTLTAGDIGSTIRVKEVATNHNGSTTAWSDPTAIVAAPPAPTPQPTPTPTPSVSSTTPTASPTSAGSPAGPPATTSVTGPSGPTATQIRAALIGILASAGKPARVGQLLAHGGYSASISVPSAGVVVVSWSLQPAKLSHGQRAGAPVVVALGRVGSTRAGTLPLKIRLTPQGRRRLARHGKLTLTVTVTFTPAGSHQALTTGRTFTLHR